MIKAVFIDFYGTVVHEDGEVIKQVSQEIYSTGKVTDKSEIGTYWWNEFQKAFNSAYEDSFETQRKLEYESLKKNIDRDDVLKAIEYHGLKPNGIFTSEDAKSYKPRKELFQFALNSTGLSAEQVVHIGDSLSSDIKGASAVGINAIWINRSKREIPNGVTAVENLLEVYNTDYFN